MSNSFDTDVDKEAFEKAEKLGAEFVIAVKGKVYERQSKTRICQLVI